LGVGTVQRDGHQPCRADLGHSENPMASSSRCAAVEPADRAAIRAALARLPPTVRNPRTGRQSVSTVPVDSPDRHTSCTWVGRVGHLCCAPDGCDESASPVGRGRIALSAA
jgi:hypothetical protein